KQAFYQRHGLPFRWSSAARCIHRSVLVYTAGFPMLTAITRAVSPAIVRCELSFIDRQPIDLLRAQQQHQAYELLLAKLGAHVVSLPADPDLPDSMFVEAPAIVLDELAVILPLGTESRRGESASLAKELVKYRKLTYVELPGTLEGGDVLRIGRKLFV